jgi:hypothetical protein
VHAGSALPVTASGISSLRTSRAGHAVRTVQELPGHTTMIYTHVLRHDATGVRSRLDLP